MRQYVSKVGQVRLDGSWLGGRPGNGFGYNSATVIDEDYLDLDGMTDLHFTVLSNDDEFDSREGESFGQRILAIAQKIALGEIDVTDEEGVRHEIGYVKSGTRVHYSNDLVNGTTVVVGNGARSRHYPIQPTQFLNWVQRSSGGNVLAAGILKEGSVMYAVTTPAFGVEQLKDFMDCVVLYMTSFDQSLTCRAMPIAFLRKSRVPVILSRKDEAGWELKHTKNMSTKVDNVVENWEVMNAVWARAMQNFLTLAERPVDFSEVVDLLYPDRTKEDDERSLLSTAHRMYTNMPNTLLGAYETIVAYDSWLRRTRAADDKMNRQMSSITGRNPWLHTALTKFSKKYNVSVTI